MRRRRDSADRGGAPAHLARAALLVGLAALGSGCRDDARAGPTAAASSGAAAGEPSAEPSSTGEAGPADAGLDAAPPEDAAPPPPPERRCPLDMVRVDRRYCVDRYEAMLVAKGTEELRLSPYYSPTRKWALYAVKEWQKGRLDIGDAKARAMPLPNLPDWQRERDVAPVALSRKGVTPNGHTSGVEAKAACENAGKRLCTFEEWRLACGGERRLKYPYGDKYEQGACNVFREAHPAAVLHDNPAIGHNDPRLNLVESKGKPLLRKTGATPRCKSEWEGDAAYDMVGNVDEWFEGDPSGGFGGGFYARATKEGCDWYTTKHPFPYADYSLGVRCCADLLPPGVAPAAGRDGDE
ncbi:MAG: SUMF1/EgtB/PvdO family nonheme iron enzyme [Polyangiaceae bacterium]|nr:SUMF1/EgtB/PvdO family nonheme iron enzyme [Polyangiaceae bacterium]